MEKNSGGGGHRASRGKMTFVNCGQPSCEGKSAILLQNLKRHTEKVHGVGVAPRIKGEQQIGGFLVGANRTSDVGGWDIMGVIWGIVINVMCRGVYKYLVCNMSSGRTE